MALDFDVDLSDRKINHGSAASLDDLGASGITAWAWLYRTSNGANKSIMSKRNSNGWHFLIGNAPAEGAMRFVHIRATTNTDFKADASNVVATNTWTFTAVTFDDAVTPKVKMYLGTLASPVAEVSGYNATTAGTGALTSDASANLWVGNLEQVGTQAFSGRITRGGVINRVLSLTELEQLWLASHRAGSPAPECNVANTKLLFDYQTTSTLTDLSGNGNDGTLTSATQADGPLFRSSLASVGV